MKNNVIDRIYDLAKKLKLEISEIERKNSTINNEEYSISNCTLFCGDNQVVLESLIGKIPQVDLCYIDPPYNTKNKFIYNDTILGDTSGIFGSHSAWMAFMLPRLILVHELMSNSGVIAISIDDYEQPYLRLLLDTIFGEENLISNFVVCRSKNGKGSKKNVAINHEYLVVYGKSKDSKIHGAHDDPSRYDKEDKHGRYRVDGLFRKKGDASKKEDRPNMFYPLYFDENGNVHTENINGLLKEVWPIDSKGVERRWLWGKEKANLDSWMLYASKNGIIYVKNYSTPDKKIKLRSILDDNRYLTECATKQITDIYGDKIFETPKPLALIEDIIFSHAGNNALIIDFFAGTGTTAHAAHNLNLLDNGSRKVILIEQDKEINSEHIASRKGYSRISQITEKRLQYLSSLTQSYRYSIIRV